MTPIVETLIHSARLRLVEARARADRAVGDPELHQAMMRGVFALEDLLASLHETPHAGANLWHERSFG
jgi:hypothetical protein